MVDFYTQERQQFIRSQSSHQQKLSDAIDWLRERGRYCLETPLEVRIYKPLNGSPLGVAK